MTTAEFLDREKTFEVALADGDDGAGSADVKMAPVGVRDLMGDALMAGAFDKQKGAVLPVLPGHQVDRPPLGRIVYQGEKSGKFVGRMEFNETSEAQEWRKAAKQGVVQASIRFRAKMKDVEKSARGFDIRKAVLREVSLTGLGAMPGTGLSRVKSEPEDSADEPAPFTRSLAATDLAHRRL